MLSEAATLLGVTGTAAVPSMTGSSVTSVMAAAPAAHPPAQIEARAFAAPFLFTTLRADSQLLCHIERKGKTYEGLGETLSILEKET